jgi:ribonucleoside-diphosphate reductase alpha chain
MEHLAHVAKLATKALDYGISLTNNPLPSTLAHNSRYRTIGIGMMGLHDFFG